MALGKDFLYLADYLGVEYSYYFNTRTDNKVMVEVRIDHGLRNLIGDLKYLASADDTPDARVAQEYVVAAKAELPLLLLLTHSTKSLQDALLATLSHSNE